MLKRIIYNLLMFMLVVSTITTALGVAYYAEPELFNWFFDWLELTEGERAYFTMALGGTTIMAWGTRVLRTIVNTDNLKRDALHTKEITLLETRHEAEMAKLKSDFETQLKITTEKSNQIIANQNILIEQNNLLLQERRINATRMIQLSSQLVSDEVKQSYKNFITSTQSIKTSPINHFYSEKVEVVKEVLKPLIDEKIVVPLSERLSTDKGVGGL